MADSSPAVVLVRPSAAGNVGTAARAMRNFGFRRFLLVDPPELDPDGEAYGFAGRAREDILPSAETVSFDEVAATFHTVGFSSVPNENATSHVRYPFVTPAELGEELAGLDAPVALVFGPERTGLNNEELARLDRICCIPATAAYPALNLGQAVTVALYELQHLTDADGQLPDRHHDRADEADIDRLYDRFDEYLEAINHPEEKRAKANRMIRRLIGRAHPTDREVVTLTGLFRRGAAFAVPPSETQDET